MNCIRPAPPTRSFFQADKRNTLRRKEVEQSSYEDDLQILRVIEAYCFSKQRQTITNSAMLDSTPYLSLADDTQSGLTRSQVSKKSIGSVSTVEDARIERLERDVLGLTRRLEMEVQTRGKLQDILIQSGINLPSDLNMQE